MSNMCMCYECITILKIMTVILLEILCILGKLLAFSKWQSWYLSPGLTPLSAAGLMWMVIKES